MEAAPVSALLCSTTDPGDEVNERTLESSPQGRLAGKVVVVTAAAGSGIGFATARRAAAEGALVVLSDAHESRLDRAAAKFADEFGARPLTVRCDVTQQGDVDHLFDVASSITGGIDVMVNNAGLGGETLLVAMTDSEWNRVLEVTLTGTFRCCRAALKHMISRGGGAVVNVASVTGWRAEAGQAHYAAAKAGVMALTRCAAVEASAAGVRVNAIAPTLTMHEHLDKSVDAATLAHWMAEQPQQRPADPMEVASVIVFLASDDASYLTGEVVSVGALHP
jgi:3-oxoacyl-[acyl-carrier protein] reductase